MIGTHPSALNAQMQRSKMITQSENNIELTYSLMRFT